MHQMKLALQQSDLNLYVARRHACESGVLGIHNKLTDHSIMSSGFGTIDNCSASSKKTSCIDNQGEFNQRQSLTFQSEVEVSDWI